jgi:hypothetical protein
MSRQMVITACGCVNEEGFGSARAWTPWPGAAPRPRWRTLSQRPFERFGRLDRLSRHAVAAAEMLALPLAEESRACPDTALVLGSEHGSLDVDFKFCRSMAEPGGASPTLFSYTLPSTALGEIAIRYAITGTNLCVSAGPESELLALWEGAKLVASGQAARCVCIGADAVAPPAAPSAAGHAYAVLIEAHAAGREPLAGLAFLPAGDAGPAAAALGEELPMLFRALSRLDGSRAGPALYLHAPAPLGVAEALVVTT